MARTESLVWGLIARVVATPGVRDWLIRRAQRTPYLHLHARNGDEPYMERWWLFNPYNRMYRGRISWLPSIRIHHICQPDSAPHPHSHPWHCRTIILRGWYCEQRVGRRKALAYTPGDTYAMQPGVDFHNIYAMGEEGVWTLFITWSLRKHTVDGTWGFLVDGQMVSAAKYKEMTWTSK